MARAVRRILGFGKEAGSAVRAALEGDVLHAVECLERAKEGATADKIKEVDGVIGYLVSNADGLGKGPSLGTIESNVDKLAANRMKKRGMSWSIKGARRMAKLLELALSGTLESVDLGAPSPKPDLTAAAPLVAQRLGPDPQRWLYASVPSLSGPDAGKPWVKVLRGIIRANDFHTSGIVPTKS